MEGGPTSVSTATLGELSKSITVPTYDRSQVKAGIVHLGLGNFHRAHMAMYTEKAIASGQNQWGICGVGLMPFDTEIRDALKT